jgi:putative Holliday junction resolvase
VRVLALDIGRKRIGLAISDPSGLLARPLMTIPGGADALTRVTSAIAAVAAEDDGVAEVVVGLPRHLNGDPSAETAVVLAFIEQLRQRLEIPVATEDERLSSREAESRLALREKDWRKRKQQLDAAAAAVILQDYLDRRTSSRGLE